MKESTIAKEYEKAQVAEMLKSNPAYAVSVSLPYLSSLLGIGLATLLRNFGEIEIPKNPERKGRYTVTGQQFIDLSEMVTRIRAEKTQRRKR